MNPKITLSHRNSPDLSRVIVGFTISFFFALITMTSFYQDISPLFSFSFLTMVGVAPLLFFPKYFEDNLAIFLKVFGIMLVVITLAQTYMYSVFDYPIQAVSDMNQLFKASRGDIGQFTIAFGQRMDSPFPVVAWQLLYNFAHALDVPMTPILGVTMNAMIISWAGVLLYRLGIMVFGKRRSVTLIWLYVSSGLIWLFAGTFLRDSFALLLNLGFVYCSVVLFSNEQSIPKRILALIMMGMFYYFSYYTRAESIFFLAAWVGFYVFFISLKNLRFLIVTLIVGAVAALAFISIFNIQELVLQYAISIARRQEFVNSANDAQGLGTAIVLSQPLPIRIILGTFLLHINPIPLWVGFDTTRGIYQWLKSLGGIHLALISPTFIMGMWVCFKNNSSFSPSALAIIRANVLFTIFSAFVIASTSMELRHYAIFLPQLLILSLLADYQDASVRRTMYYMYLFWVIVVINAHFMWTYLKFF